MFKFLISGLIPVSTNSIQLLTVARESVQNALFLHLIESGQPLQTVITRFGRLLLLVSTVSVRESLFYPFIYK
jgi:hypothetical protein